MSSNTYVCLHCSISEPSACAGCGKVIAHKRTSVQMPPKFAKSSWRNEDTAQEKIDEYKFSINHLLGLIPDHKIDKNFMNRHPLEAAIRMQWNIDEDYQGCDIFAISEVDSFNKIKAITSGRSFDLGSNCSNVLHIDEFVISFTDRHSQYISTEIDRRQEEYHRTNTEYSPQTFNALMRMIAARISILDNYCVCGDGENCEKSPKCPEIQLNLTSLDDNNKRVFAVDDDFEKVQADKIVTINHQAVDRLNENEDSIRSTTTSAKVTIDVACLRRLLNDTKPGIPLAPATFDRDKTAQWLSMVENGVDDSLCEPVNNEEDQSQDSDTMHDDILHRPRITANDAYVLVETSDDDDDIPRTGARKRVRIG